MPRPFSLEKCESRDQISKQYERMLEALIRAGIHATIVYNSYGEGYETYAAQAEALVTAIDTLIELVESVKANS